MIQTNELNNDVINFVRNLGIICDIEMDIITINRTSMVNCVYCNGLDEDDSYHKVLTLIKEEFSNPKYYWITFSGKTDNVYYLEVYEKN